MRTREGSVNSLGAIPSGGLRRRKLIKREKKLNQANEMIALCNSVMEAKNGVNLLKYPSGRYGFVGSVPIDLSYIHDDGSFLSDTEASELLRSGNPAMYAKIIKANARVFTTPKDALKAAKELKVFVVNADEFNEEASISIVSITFPMSMKAEKAKLQKEIEALAVKRGGEPFSDDDIGTANYKDGFYLAYSFENWDANAKSFMSSLQGKYPDATVNRDVE